MKIKTILLCFLSLSLLTGCSGVRFMEKGDSWKRIEQQKKVIIGLDDTFVPMGFQEKNGNLTGFDVDLAKAVFKLYDIHVDFQAIDWNMKENELKNQTIDLIWNGYTINPEREKTVLFSKPYMKNDQVLVTLKKDMIHSFQEMKNKVLGLQNASSGMDVFDSEPKILKDIVKGSPVLYSGFNEAMMDLNAGRIQGVLIDRVYADYTIHHEPNRQDYLILTGSYKSEDYAVGARKQDVDLINKVNEGIQTLQKNGEFSKISKKWFGEDVSNVK